ncbi:hypothetical protein [Pseudohongiella spirulinae]|uniref:Glycosyltransferase RgtA/B/C/D-like domain-containing protein n=1 Tax=Pseudohongiella spirulinae TaxID=1249552 RepID=A0A0S2K9S1_9GAMM|nr:hypothetical protein [Pseudohongiella spirulinae]ALO45000.1 hypothetical protein PS2015_309 [Pseudohongiella spirulinae]
MTSNQAYMQRLPSLTMIRVFTVLMSLFLSWLAVTLHSQPNTDAYTYIRAADMALQAGIPAAYEHHQWAHLSVLIALLTKLTGIDLLQSAYVISALMYAFLSLCFVNLVAALAPTRRVVWLATIVILSYPHINEFRSYIIRDIGFLAFMLAAMLQLLQYNRSLLMRHVSLFIVFCLSASFFRPEALLFMFVTPVSLLMNRLLSENNRRRGFLRLESTALLLCALLLALVAWRESGLVSQLFSFASIYQPFLSNINIYFSGSDTISRAVFGEYGAQFSDQYTGLFLLTGLLSVLLASIIESLGWVAGGFLAYGLYRRYVKVEHTAMNIVLLWAGTALFILVAFILLTRFMTTRYTLMLGTTLLIFVPFIIDRAWSVSIANGRQKRFVGILILAGLFAFIDSHISFGDDKSHLDSALQYIQTQTRQDAPLLTNEIYLAYSSGRVNDYEHIHRDMNAGEFMQAPVGTIVAVTVRRSFQSQLEAEIQRGALRLIEVFPAQRGGDFMIFEKELR